MPRKTRGWLRKMRKLGLGRHGFGGWMSGSEWMVHRGNLREMAVVQERQGRNSAVLGHLGLVQSKISEVHEQVGLVQGKMNVIQEDPGLAQGKKSAVQEHSGLRQGKKSVVQKDNVYPLLPRKAAAKIPPLSPIALLEVDKWVLRKQLIIQIAKRRSGKVRLQEVAAECNVNIRIAAEWLKRLCLEGMLSLVAGQRNVMVYSLKDVGRVHK
ncbi:hypothetical protein [Paenibacillus sp. Root444D2]|uniref:hypothetical protein n=1 Tax=Paenibacillus sp. Root444D2 TaxID=1736538 RepID=UPI00070CBCB9|nr:hypothetical protein [Paenibacillus sp. Root444D2]KQX51940.1 hypothetical protein ASD40_07675 [Paenibacillus sp. Root444D2]